MNVASLLVRAARSRPDNPALYQGETLVADYREFHRRAAAIAGWLRCEAGLKSGDCVGFAMTNCTEFSGNPLWQLDGGPDRGADQRQASPERIRLYPGELGLTAVLRYRRPAGRIGKRVR